MRPVLTVGFPGSSRNFNRMGGPMRHVTPDNRDFLRALVTELATDR